MTAQTVEIKRVDQGSKGEYVAQLADGENVGVLIWAQVGNDRVAEHTIVEPEYRGQGIAGKLVDDMVADARQNGFKIVPQCAYVVAAFERHPDWADVRA